MLISAAKYPATAILAILVLLSSIIFEDDLPLVPIGIGSFHISDVILILCLLRLFYLWCSDKKFSFAPSRLNRPLGLFYSYMVVMAYASIKVYGMEFGTVIKAVRPFTYFLLFYLVTNLVRDRKQLRFLINGMLLVGAVVAVAMIAQALIGESIKIIPGRIEESETLGQSYGALRLLPPGQTLLYVLFITTVCLLAVASSPLPVLLWHTSLIVLLGIGVTLTYNRTYWVAITMAVALLFFLLPLSNKFRLVKFSFLGLALMSVVTITGMTTNRKYNEYVVSISDRYFSLLSGKDLTESGSVSDRFLENSYAVAKFKENPLFGSGLYNSYRPEIYQEGEDITYYVHNGYLWILKDMGLVGMFLFLWFYLGFLVRSWRGWKRIEDDYFRAVLLGFMLSGLGIVPMVLFNPIFLQWFSIVVLSIMIGLSEAILADNDGPRLRAETAATVAR